MAKSCPICNKGTQVGGGYSNSVRATQFDLDVCVFLINDYLSQTPLICHH